MPTAYPPIRRYSTWFELSDFKNSLKSLASAGVAIEGPSQKFERPQPLLDWPGQPVPGRIVRIGQAHDGELRAIQPELVDPVLRRHPHSFSLPPESGAFWVVSRGPCRDLARSLHRQFTWGRSMQRCSRGALAVQRQRLL